MPSIYEHKGVSFVPHRDWIDRTIVAFTAPPRPGKHAANLVVTQEPLRDGDTLRVHADRILMETARQLQHFELLESREATLADLPAVFARFRLTTHFSVVEQRMTLVALETDEGRLVTTFTTTTPSDQVEEMQPVFEQMLRSVRFECMPAASAPSPAPAEEPWLPTTNFVPMPGQRRR